MRKAIESQGDIDPKEQIVLVFLDESGDLGMKIGQGSSPYLFMAAVVFRTSDLAAAVDRRISDLRIRLGLPGRYEFKFASMSRTRRLDFLQACAPFGFLHYSVAIDKRRLREDEFRDRESLYVFAGRLALVGVQGELRDAKIVIDRLGSKGLRQNLDRELRRQVNESGGHVRKVEMQESHRQNLLQLADMVVGAIARSFTDKDDAQVYRNVIRHGEAGVTRWPS